MFEQDEVIYLVLGGGLVMATAAVTTLAFCTEAIKRNLSYSWARGLLTPPSRRDIVAIVCQMAKNPSLQNNATRCKIQMESSFISPNENPDSTSKTECTKSEKGAISINENLNLTPFLCACIGGSLDLINFMLQRGADPNIVDEIGDGPLYLTTFGVICRLKLKPCSAQRSFEITNATLVLDALLNAGCDVNAGNRSSYRPLHLAASSGHRWLVDNLLLRGADPHVRNDCGLRPSDCAILRGHIRIANLLKKAEKNHSSGECN